MKIGFEKRKNVESFILFVLKNTNKPLFTVRIAEKIGRDESYTKKILLSLFKKRMVKRIIKNEQGVEYKVRRKWVLNPDYKEIKFVFPKNSNDI